MEPPCVSYKYGDTHDCEFRTIPGLHIRITSIPDPVTGLPMILMTASLSWPLYDPCKPWEMYFSLQRGSGTNSHPDIKTWSVTCTGNDEYRHGWSKTETSSNKDLWMKITPHTISQHNRFSPIGKRITYRPPSLAPPAEDA